MSTKSFIPEMRKGISPSVLVLLSGVLIALQLVLPAAAFASFTRAAAPKPPEDQAFALAEVSVVRLVVSYISNTLPVGGGKIGPSAECTGLGVLVAIGYLISLRLHPFTRCPACKGLGTPGRTHGFIYRYAHRRCPANSVTRSWALMACECSRTRSFPASVYLSTEQTSPIR